MEVSVRYSPSFAVARCALAPGEEVRAEAGAMMAHSDGVEVEAKMQGGFLKSLKRSALGGESFFMTTFRAPTQGGWVDVAARLPGDLVVRRVSPDRPLFIQAGSYLASDMGVNIETKWGGFKNLFGSEGGFLVRAEGGGQVALSCYGALDSFVLGPGERLVLDTGHMVAFEEGVQSKLRRISGTWTSLKSAEVLVFEFTGPGEVLAQSRNPNEFLEFLANNLPFSRD